MTIRRIRDLAVLALGAALTWAAIEAALLMRDTRLAVTQAVELADSHLEQARLAADARIADAIVRAESQIAGMRSDSVREIAETRALLLRRVDDLVARTDTRLGAIHEDLAAVTGRAATAATAAASLVEDARPGVQAWSSMSPHLAANVLGAVAAAKVTAGETAQTMREIRRATPDLLESVRVSALASQQAAQSAAQTSQHLAEITKPGPRWLRYVGVGATIAVPAAQVALPFTVLAQK